MRYDWSIACRFGFYDMQNYQCLGKSYQPRLRLALVYYTSKNPCRVSHAMRPGLKDVVKCILRIGSAYSKGGGGFRFKHCPNFASFELFVNRNSVRYSVSV